MLKYISLSRSQLMAFAIFGTMLVHSGMIIHIPFLYKFVQNGYLGVDLFFFLSGFGLFYSCEKDSRMLPFWWKRIKRITPPLCVCIIVSQLISQGTLNWTEIWQSCLYIGFWIKQLNWYYFVWFVPGIMALYLVFPIFYRIFKHYPLGATIHASLIGIFAAQLLAYEFLIVNPTAYTDRTLLCTRVPIFFIGTYFAWLTSREKKGELCLSSNQLILLFFLPFVGFELRDILTHVGMSYNQLRNSGAIFYPLILIIPGATIAAGYAISFFPKFLNKILAIIGNSTLEAYCLMGCVFKYQANFESWIGNNIVSSSLMMLCCIILACIIHYIVAFIIKLPSCFYKRVFK